MSNIKTLGILLTLSFATPALADEACEFISTDYCYSLAYDETDNISFPGVADHGPTFTLSHGSVLGIQPFYNTYEGSSAEPEDLPDHQAFVRDTGEKCTIDPLVKPYKGTRISCPQEKEMSWAFPFFDWNYTTYASLRNLNEEDRPRYDAIINSLVVYTEAECQKMMALSRQNYCETYPAECAPEVEEKQGFQVLGPSTDCNGQKLRKAMAVGK